MQSMCIVSNMRAFYFFLEYNVSQFRTYANFVEEALFPTARYSIQETKKLDIFREMAENFGKRYDAASRARWSHVIYKRRYKGQHYLCLIVRV